MKKSNILKLIVVAAIACITVIATVALSACGSAKLVGTYKAYKANNHSDVADGYQHEYTLEVYGDNTYRMEYNAFYAIPFWQGVSSRTVIQYGKYTKATTEEEGKVAYELGKPTRVIYMAMCGGYNGIPTDVKAFADTDNWDKISPANEDGSLVFALHSRSESEEYASAEQLLNTLGRTYKVTCDASELHRITTLEVTSHGGKQINGYDNIVVEEEGWPAA